MINIYNKPKKDDSDAMLTFRYMRESKRPIYQPKRSLLQRIAHWMRGNRRNVYKPSQGYGMTWLAIMLALSILAMFIIVNTDPATINGVLYK